MTRDAAGDAANDDRWSGFPLASIVKDYLPALGALGILLYGLLRLAYVFFYLRLRATPEEVGYDYSRVLSESIAGAIELTVLCATAFVALGALYYVTRAVIGMSRGREAFSFRRLVHQVPGTSLRRLALRSTMAAVVFVLASLPVLAWWQGGLAQEGQTVRNVYFIGIPYLPVLAVQAVPARVSWVDGDQNKPVQLAGRDCLLYLGQANQSAVFYDVKTHESIRLPSSNIVVLLRFAFFVPQACRQ